jgi:hypothetical protein
VIKVFEFSVKGCAMESNVEQQSPSQKFQIYSTANTGVTPFWKGLSIFLFLKKTKFLT